VHGSGGNLASLPIRKFARAFLNKLALRIARDEIQLADLNAESIANLEAVIYVIGRPSWFVRQDIPETQEMASSQSADEFWVMLIANAKQALWRVCSCIGCVTSVRCGFGQETFSGRHGNGRDSPIAAVHWNARTRTCRLGEPGTGGSRSCAFDPFGME
jgi:hypothetical protein